MDLIENYELIFIYNNEQIEKSSIRDEKKELENYAISKFNSGNLEGSFSIGVTSNNNEHNFDMIHFKFIKK